MLVFATVPDVVGGEWLSDSSTLSDSDLGRLLRQASAQVRYATRAARYDTTSGGLPADPVLSQALRDATCAQVAFWDRTGTSPDSIVTASATVSSKSMGGRSVSYRDNSAEVSRAASGLCDEAAKMLSDAGLLNGSVLAW